MIAAESSSPDSVASPPRVCSPVTRISRISRARDIAVVAVLLAACTDRSQPADDPPYETWDDACTVWQGIEVRKMDAVDYDAVVDIIIDTRAACDFYEHDAPPECTEILWDLLACQEALDPPYTCCDEGKPCHDEFVAAQFDEGDPCSPP